MINYSETPKLTINGMEVAYETVPGSAAVETTLKNEWTTSAPADAEWGTVNERSHRARNARMYRLKCQHCSIIVVRCARRRQVTCFTCKTNRVKEARNVNSGVK